MITQYIPDNHLDYLENKYFHSEDKGCDLELVKRLGTRKGEPKVPGEYKVCHTHDTLCSKSGWELGFFMGSDSRAYNRKLYHCLNCGREVMSKALNFKYCKECKVIMSNKRAKERLITLKGNN